MFSSLSKFFSNEATGKSGEQEQEHRLRVATCVLLLEAAQADDTFSDEERQTIKIQVGKRFGLAEGEVRKLLAQAEQERSAGGDLFFFARQISEHYPRSRRLAILELLWEVVYSDGILEAHEDALMHKLGTLLGVRHEELMAVKLSVRKRLEGH